MKTTAPFFDRLCQLAERWLPEIDPWLRQARLFVFEHKSYEFVRTTMTAEEIELLNEAFFLPFPVVAVEDPASVVVLADLQPDAAGVGARRGYVELVDQRGEGFHEDRDGRPAAKQAFAAGTLVHIGLIAMTAKAGEVSMVDAAGHHTGFDLRGGVHKACWFAGDGAPEILTEEQIPHEQMIGFLRNPATAQPREQPDPLVPGPEVPPEGPPPPAVPGAAGAARGPLRGPETPSEPWEVGQPCGGSPLPSDHPRRSAGRGGLGRPRGSRAKQATPGC